MTQKKNEKWRPVVGFEGQYEVSNIGRVRSLNRTLTYDRFDPRIEKTITIRRYFRGRLLKAFPASRNYIAVNLGYGNQHLVHTLMLRAFVGAPRPSEQSLHWDGDPSNNILSNLRWGTRVENNADSVRHGTRIMGEKHPQSKLKLRDIIKLRAAPKHRGFYKAMADKLGVHSSTVRRAVTGYYWGHIT